MAIMQIVVMPRGGDTTRTTSFYVAEIHKFLKTQKLRHQLHDMGTLVEGTSAELWALAKKLHEMPFRMGSQRVYTIVNIDDRRDKKISLGDKIKSVQKRMKARK